MTGRGNSRSLNADEPMKGTTMQQIQIKTRPRPRHTTPDDPPTINRKIARTWFADSQPPTTGKSALANKRGKGLPLAGSAAATTLWHAGPNPMPPD
jgi:hypothetical protein